MTRLDIKKRRPRVQPVNDGCPVRMFGGSQGSRIHLCREPLAGGFWLCLKHTADRERILLADRDRASQQIVSRNR